MLGTTTRPPLTPVRERDENNSTSNGETKKNAILQEQQHQDDLTKRNAKAPSPKKTNIEQQQQQQQQQLTGAERMKRLQQQILMNDQAVFGDCIDSQSLSPKESKHTKEYDAEFNAKTSNTNMFAKKLTGVTLSPSPDIKRAAPTLNLDNALSSSPNYEHTSPTKRKNTNADMSMNILLEASPLNKEFAVPFSRNLFGSKPAISSLRGPEAPTTRMHWARQPPAKGVKDLRKTHGLRRSQTDSMPPATLKNKIPIGPNAVSLVDSFCSGSDAIPRITPSTLIKLIEGDHPEFEQFYIIDARFQYEYSGGHIRGAHNIIYPEELIEQFFAPDMLKKAGRVCLIFHCEFSSHRAPRLALHLRSRDRAENTYPDLYYPHVYILEGGYKNFFKSAVSHCDPPLYIEMKDPRYLTELRSMMNSTRTTWRRHSSFAESASGTDLFADLDDPPFKVRRTSDASVFGLEETDNKRNRLIIKEPSATAAAQAKTDKYSPTSKLCQKVNAESEEGEP